MSKYFHYTACGLDNVWLANGFKVKTTRHGNAVAVNGVDGLHQLIAQTLIDKPGRLTGKDTVPAACDQWLRMLVLARLEGNAKLADAIARTQSVHKLIYQKYVVREVNGKRELSVLKQPRAPLSA